MKKYEIKIPAELLWDYKEPPEDILWRLQRIADFFPAWGTDKKTVNFLFKYKDRLKIEEGKYKLIIIYYEVWNEKSIRRNKKQ